MTAKWTKVCCQLGSTWVKPQSREHPHRIPTTSPKASVCNDIINYSPWIVARSLRSLRDRHYCPPLTMTRLKLREGKEPSCLCCMWIQTETSVSGQFIQCTCPPALRVSKLLRALQQAKRATPKLKHRFLWATTPQGSGGGALKISTGV